MTKDHAVAAGMIVLAAIYLYATAQFPRIEIGDPLGPKAFPFLLGMIMVLSVSLLLWETRGPSVKVSEPREVEGRQVGASDGRRKMAIAAVAGSIALYFALFVPLGYVLSTTCFLLALMIWLNADRWVSNVAISAGFSVCSYLLFVKLFGVALPSGFLPF